MTCAASNRFYEIRPSTIGHSDSRQAAGTTDRRVCGERPGRGFVVRGIAEGVGRDDLQAATEAPLSFADEVVVLAEQA